MSKDYSNNVYNLIHSEERAAKTGWSLDMESAPVDKWILLQSETDETLIYMGKLERQKDGSINRKISRTPWQEDADERFFRDSIVAWFDAKSITDFLHESYRAALLSQGPVVSCSKVNDDGSISIVYKRGTVPEYRRHVRLGGPNPDKYKIPEMSIQDYVLYGRN